MTRGLKPAEKTLLRLLKRVEQTMFSRGCAFVDQDAIRRISLRFTAKSVPEYHTLPDFGAREAYHAAMLAAQRLGAVQLEWDDRAGKRVALERIKVLDPSALATACDEPPAWVVAADAADELRKDYPDVPGALRFASAWRQGGSPRGRGPERIQEVRDASVLLRALHSANGETPPTQLLRRVSARLFGDSKRIEKLATVLDFMVSEEGDDLGGSEDVLARLGLIKHPQPMLIAGDLTVVAVNGEIECPWPYIGVAPDIVRGVRSDRLNRLLSIENLATFNEVSRGRSPGDTTLILYTAGMPTPAFLAAYGRILADLPSACEVLHWGDIDRGGFRIAAQLHRVCCRHDRLLLPHLMDPQDVGMHAPPDARVLDRSEVSSMRRLANEMGWGAVAKSLSDGQVAIEQESISFESNEWSIFHDSIGHLG